MTMYKSIDELPMVLNGEDVAAYLNISRAGAYKLIGKADFPSLKIGRRIIVPREEFLNWIKKNISK